MPPKCIQCGEYCTRERPCRCCQANPATVPSEPEYNDNGNPKGYASGHWRAHCLKLEQQLQEAVGLLDIGTEAGNHLAMREIANYPNGSEAIRVMFHSQETEQ